MDFYFSTPTDYISYDSSLAYITSRFGSLSSKSRRFVIYILDAYYDPGQSVSPHIQNSTITADAYVMSLLNVSLNYRNSYCITSETGSFKDRGSAVFPLRVLSLPSPKPDSESHLHEAAAVAQETVGEVVC
jgi:hypothetical protein